MGKAQDALKWAIAHYGYKYSQDRRWEGNYFDCSSLIYRAYQAVGITLRHKDTGEVVSTSTTEVYAKGFRLLSPSSYNDIGKHLPSSVGLLNSIGLQPGDIIFYNHKTTTRPNKITHVALYAGNEQIFHARNPQLGVRWDPLSYMQTSVCAIIRYVENGKETQPGSNLTSYVYRLLKLTSPMIGGDDVRWLQSELNTRGHNSGTVDGVFGKNTDKAVRAFQKAQKLAVDGIAGEKTISALGGVYRK